ISGRETRTLREHHDWTSCLTFLPDASVLATGSFDRTVRLWNAGSPPWPPSPLCTRRRERDRIVYRSTTCGKSARRLSIHHGLQAPNRLDLPAPSVGHPRQTRGTTRSAFALLSVQTETASCERGGARSGATGRQPLMPRRPRSSREC